MTGITAGARPTAGAMEMSDVRSIATRWRETRYLPIRSLTPASLGTALDRFAAGWVRDAALVYEAIEQRDGVVKTALGKRRKAVSRRPWAVLTLEESPEADAHRAALEWFYNHVTATDATDLNERSGFAGLVRQMLDAVRDRYAVHEVVWQPRGEMLTATFRRVPLYFFENRTGRLRFTGPEIRTEGLELSEGGWMTTVGDGVGEALAVAYMFKRLSLQDWLNFGEKFGVPGIHGQTDAAPGSAEWEAFVTALRAFASDWVTATNRGAEIKLIETARGGGDVPFAPMVAYMDKVISALCRGADLSTMSAADSEGASLQGEEGDLIIEDDCMMVSETLNTQIDRQVIAWHFGAGVEPLAYIKLMPPTNDDTRLDIEVDKFLREAGVRLDPADLAERYGRQIAEEPTAAGAAANDANFDAAHLSEPLTDYIVDYPDEDGLAALLDGAAPMIPVGRSFSYRTHDDAEAFQAALADEDIREIGGEFARVRRTGSQADGRTDNKGLIMVLDNDQGGEDPAVQQRAVANLRARLLRTELKRLVMLLDANDTAAPSENWGPSNAGADPDGSILNQVDLSGDERGIDPSVVLFGGGAKVKRKRSMSVRDKAGAFAGLMMTDADLAGLYGVQRVLTSKFRYQSAASTKSKVIADQVWIYDARPGLMGEDPSNIKRFVTLPGGQQFRVYVESRLKQTLIAVEHYSRIICTSSLGIRQLPVTYS